MFDNLTLENRQIQHGCRFGSFGGRSNPEPAILNSRQKLLCQLPFSVVLENPCLVNSHHRISVSSTSTFLTPNIASKLFLMTDLIPGLCNQLGNFCTYALYCCTSYRGCHFHAELKYTIKYRVLCKKHNFNTPSCILENI